LAWNLHRPEKQEMPFPTYFLTTRISPEAGDFPGVYKSIHIGNFISGFPKFTFRLTIHSKKIILKTKNLMKSISIFSLGNPGSYDPETDYVNRLHYEMSYNLWLMSDEGMTVSQPEASDVASNEADITAFLVSFESWLEAAFAAYQAEEEIPDMPAFPSLSTWSFKGWMPILLRAAIQLLILYLEKRFGGILPPGTGIDDVLKKILSRSWLTSEDLEEAQPLLGLFAGQPINIRLSYGNRIEEVFLDSV
jgi:hypothetical protein